jgi:3-dehydroquinate synthase
LNLSREKPAADHETVRVDLAARSYDILVGQGLLAETGHHVGAVAKGRRCVVITDEAVAPLYLDAVRAGLEGAGLNAEAIVLPEGEHTKDLRHLGDLADRLLDLRIDRSSILVALGGGVVGDIAGFAAAIVLRGIACIQVPTTLLAQIDSSVGGKTGINSKFGKNLVGSFHQPRLVLADTAALDSLPRRELLAGYAEMVKYALIDDADFFTWLEANGAAIVGEGDEAEAARREAIAVCCRAKARIVAADEREAGVRALLNLGHTFGHALEAETGFADALLHGEAVAIGTVMAFALSVRMGLCPAEDLARVAAHFAAIGLAAAPPALQGKPWNPANLLAHMARDKKARAGRKTLILARGIGRSFVTDEVTDGDILATLEAAVAP